MPRRIHHIAIGALDVERVARFYREALGLTERASHVDAGGALRSIWLDADDAIVMIERAAEARARVDGVAAGLFIVVFAVGARERATLEGRLAGMGVEIEERTRFTSYARDPEGNRFGFSSWPEPSEG